MIVLLAQFLAFRSSAQVNYVSSILFLVCFCFFFSEKLKEELKKERRAKEEVRITCQPISPCYNKGENNSYTEDFAVYIQFRSISIFSSIYFTTNWVINIVGYTETS